MFDHFDFLAPIYDRAIPFSRLDLLLDLLKPLDRGRLLDVCGGTGRVALALSPYVNFTCVLDLSRGMLDQATKKGLDAIFSPAERLPFDNDTFDRIVMIDALHHVFKQDMVILELWRILKQGGILVIEEPDLRKWQVKLLAIVEKILFMRSYFIKPPEIAKLFPTEAKIEIVVIGYNSWLVVKKD